MSDTSACSHPQPYAELHCRSHFSFLDGASSPDELVAEAVQRGIGALAITDRHGLYGAVRFARAARDVSLRTVFGAQITLAHGPVRGDVVVLARGPAGYRALSMAITAAQLRGRKSHPHVDLDDLATTMAGECWVLTAGHGGAVPDALVNDGPAAAHRALGEIVSRFGADRVVVELWDHADPLDSVRNDALVALAARTGLECVATNDVSYARAGDHAVACAVAAVRRRSSLDVVDPHLPPSGAAFIRSPAEQMRRFRRYPGVVEYSAVIADDAAFDLALIAPRLPPFRCPPGHDEVSYLRHLVEAGARRRYGARPDHDDGSLAARAWRTLNHELGVIDALGFAGYFLVVWDIVEFCRRNDVLCQGRGSAANSAVCFCLGITNVDAVGLGLLFERFLSTERDGPPDIDIDIESGRRDEVIAYVFEKYGRLHAAQVANVVTYRARSAVRDMARALGHDPAAQDAFARRFDSWDPVTRHDTTGVPVELVRLAAAVQDTPRHLGIHSGGIVICDRPVAEVCPVEWATMPGRSVLQWDKEDCAAVGLVKFDLLGLGMLSALHRAIDLHAEHRGRVIDLGALPQESEVYAMLSRADTVGVFQVESRAQMSTLPRLAPRNFYDLVVEVALIRPGPIQGGSVHPYIRRRNGREPVTYLHPLLENSLKKTLGVPLFQEQLMQMAIDVAGFSPAHADELRQAMGAKRSRARMARLRERLHAGMSERGIGRDVAEQIIAKMEAFAHYGFPESHAVSFAHLVYASAWLKYHEPAIFCAALLDSQPMGFWSPHTLVRDARRHGVVVRTPDLNASRARTSLFVDGASTGGLAVRLGIAQVRGIGADLARRIEESRPFADIADLVRRVPQLSQRQLEALATAGAFEECFGVGRRAGMWKAGLVIHERPDRLAGTAATLTPPLPGMAPVEEAAADLWSTGVSPDGHPTTFVRDSLDARKVKVIADALRAGHGVRVAVAGVITHRQRPPTANGVTFLNVEDETGMVNVVCSRGCWQRHSEVLAGARAVIVWGSLEVADGAVNLRAEKFEELRVSYAVASRDYR